MKTRRHILSLALAAALCCGVVFAAGGDANDPLVSLAYLKNIFLPSAEQAISQKIDASGQAAYDAAQDKWESALAARGESTMERTRTWSEVRLKEGDVLSGVTGTQVLLLAGEGSVRFDGGAVIDVTDGTEVQSGSTLVKQHRYMVAEDTRAAFTVTSRTAVLDHCGDYRFGLSDGTADYNAMAAALKYLSLLKGTDLGYGQGFELERAPARIEALVMLIRLLGEEEAALASTAEHPFTDVPAWADRYVAYAYDKGYTNGIGGALFGTLRQVVAVEYTEFVLRALGYSSTAQTNITDALDRALAAKVITEGERTMWQNETFLRADVAYLSFYALESPLSGTNTKLHEKLRGSGVFTDAQYAQAKASVPSARL